MENKFNSFPQKKKNNVVESLSWLFNWHILYNEKYFNINITKVFIKHVYSLFISIDFPKCVIKKFLGEF